MTDSYPQADNVQRLLALCGIVGPVVFVFVVALHGFVRSDYSHVESHISQLGATGAQYAVAQNVNFVAAGLLFVGFGVALCRGVRTERAGKAGPAVVVLAGVGAIGLGIFPQDQLPAPEPTFSHDMHGWFAAVMFLMIIVAPLVFWRSLPRDEFWRRYRPYSLVTGIALLVLTILTVLSHPVENIIPAWRPWAGLIQRHLVGVWMVWMEVMSIKLLRLTYRSPT